MKEAGAEKERLLRTLNERDQEEGGVKKEGKRTTKGRQGRPCAVIGRHVAVTHMV